MSKKMACILIAHGLALALLGLVLQQAAPAQAKVAFPAGLGGGALCMMWGFLGWIGQKRRVWAILTLIPVTFVMLTQVVTAWISIIDGSSKGLVGALILTLMLVLPMAMLMYLLHGERPPEFYTTSPPVGGDSGPRGRNARF